MNNLRGLYLITNDDEFALLKQKVEVALDTAPVALLQYRRKKVTHTQQPQEIEQLKTICQHYQVPLVINDNLAQAQQFEAGLHLGQGDGSVRQARQILGQQAIIGRTCHTSLALAEQAAADGASYLAFGAVYPSTTKPEARPLHLSILAQAKQQFGLPVCVIGGLQVENSRPLIEQDVDLFAVVGDVFNLAVAQIPKRIRQWQSILQF